MLRTFMNFENKFNFNFMVSRFQIYFDTDVTESNATFSIEKYLPILSNRTRYARDLITNTTETNIICTYIL